MNDVKVYFAGKIGANDWRHQVAQGLRTVAAGNDVTDKEMWRGFPLPTKFPGVGYTGPFMLGCDHGCYHGESTHGCGVGYAFGCRGFSDPVRSDVVRWCTALIHASDVVFAWLDTGDCYGTLVEVGYAVGSHTPVIVGVSERLSPTLRDDLWFPQEVASVVRVGSDPISCFESFVRDGVLEDTVFSNCLQSSKALETKG